MHHEEIAWHRVVRNSCFIGVLLWNTAYGQDGAADLSKQVAELTALVQRLQARVSELETRMPPAPPAVPTVAPTVTLDSHPLPPSTAPSAADSWHGTTLNLLFDGYYGVNTNNPIGRVNLLRAFDVSSNAFSLNQAGIVIENAPDPANGKRFGARLDLQFGQATATLQGNPVNEPRPDIYRNIFQAYGTYVIGNRLTLDFGKFASSLGIENNYTQDQINYSRAYWFNFLPFYHMGVRAAYKVSDALTVNYWVVNGTGWTEAFNGFKDEFVGLTLQPRRSISWNVNYYCGQEHPDVVFLPNSTNPSLPTEQGLPFEPIQPAANGKLHIIDSYATWQATPKLALALEGDYVIQRLWTYSPPSHTSGGAAYVRYQVSPKFAIGGRTEYLSDRGGLFSGATQALKETTLTLEQKIRAGFLLREEWRRDFSNRRYFLTDTLGILKEEQNTVTMGLVWWFGHLVTTSASGLGPHLSPDSAQAQVQLKNVDPSLAEQSQIGDLCKLCNQTIHLIGANATSLRDPRSLGLDHEFPRK